MTLQVIQAIEHSYLAHIPTDLRASISLQRPLYVACSGGRDSMALLYGLLQTGLPIHVIHVNHRIQAISDDWQAVVENFCQDHHVPFDSVRLSWTTPTPAINEHINEQQARTARYQALLSIVSENAIIALAHHGDDQAETVLMNLCQGTGLAGLAGMRAFSQQAEFDKPVWLWRPLLNVSRAEITEFVKEFQLPYVDDPTNVGEHNQRAFLRQHILPKLAQRFSGLTENIARTAQNSHEANTILQDYVTQTLNEKTSPVSDSWTGCQRILDIELLLELPKSQRFLVLHRWVKGQEKFAPNRQCIEQIDALLHTQNSDYTAIIQWQGKHIRRYRNRLYQLEKPYGDLLTPHTGSQTGLIPILWQPHLAVNLIKTDISQLHLQPSFELAHWQTQVGAELRLRPVVLGEKFLLMGKHHRQSLKKICQTLGIPPWERQLAFVLEINPTNQAAQAIAVILPSKNFTLHSNILGGKFSQAISNLTLTIVANS